MRLVWRRVREGGPVVRVVEVVRSLRCAHCGWKTDDLKLSDREWRCSGCGALNELDLNAAMNLSNWPGLSFPVSGRGDRVSPASPAVVVEASTDYALPLT